VAPVGPARNLSLDLKLTDRVIGSRGRVGNKRAARQAEQEEEAVHESAREPVGEMLLSETVQFKGAITTNGDS
jgi:hypothetical protein